MKKNTKITVLGGGLWGTVLAGHLGQDPRKEVWLWEFFAEAAAALHRTRTHVHIPGFTLPRRVAVTSDLRRAIERADVLLFVLPSGAVRATARGIGKTGGWGPGTVAVNASKGIEPGSLMTMGEVIASELPRLAALYTLSGPSFAREVAKGIPTKVILAGPGGPAAARLRGFFEGDGLAVEARTDRKGVELGGSLKNVLAIGCGILDGLAAGANTKAALIVQGMAEMSELIRKSGGRGETIYGLAGLGDLIATGTSPESRNRAFGEKLGRGLSAATARRQIPTVVEGSEAAESARALARRLRVKAPLLEAIWSVVHRGRPARTVVAALGFRA